MRSRNRLLDLRARCERNHEVLRIERETVGETWWLVPDSRGGDTWLGRRRIGTEIGHDERLAPATVASLLEAPDAEWAVVLVEERPAPTAPATGRAGVVPR